MTVRLALLDYGMGNIHSLKKGLEHAGATVQVVQDAEGLRGADGILLPGVGAFGPAAKHIAPMRDQLRQLLEAGTPVLGICLGMQLLFDGSEEAPGAKGLGWIPGTVRRVKDPKLPQIGWNTLDPVQDDPLMEGAGGAYVYYVNSYAAPMGAHTVASTTYGDDTFSAVVRKGDAWGCQFHPEKSSTVGLAILANFVRMLEARS